MGGVEMMARQQRSSLALVWGLVCGGIYIAIALAGRFLGIPIERRIGAITVGQGMLLLIELALLVVAGVLAARRSGRVESGALAGVIAGLVIGIAVFVLVLGGGLALQQRVHALAARTLGLRAAYVVALVQASVGIGLTALVGLALGALGGLIGRGQSQPPAMQTYATGATGPRAQPFEPGASAPARSFSASFGTPHYPGGDAPTIQTPPPEG
jgi:hypothetical protein